MKKTYEHPVTTVLLFQTDNDLLLPASVGDTTDENFSRTIEEWGESLGSRRARPRYDCWEYEVDEESEF